MGGTLSSRLQFEEEDRAKEEKEYGKDKEHTEVNKIQLRNAPQMHIIGKYQDPDVQNRVPESKIYFILTFYNQKLITLQVLYLHDFKKNHWHRAFVNEHIQTMAFNQWDAIVRSLMAGGIASAIQNDSSLPNKHSSPFLTAEILRQWCGRSNDPEKDPVQLRRLLGHSVSSNVLSNTRYVIFEGTLEAWNGSTSMDWKDFIVRLNAERDHTFAKELMRALEHIEDKPPKPISVVKTFPNFFNWERIPSSLPPRERRRRRYDDDQDRYLPPPIQPVPIMGTRPDIPPQDYSFLRDHPLPTYIPYTDNRNPIPMPAPAPIPIPIRSITPAHVSYTEKRRYIPPPPPKSKWQTPDPTIARIPPPIPPKPKWLKPEPTIAEILSTPSDPPEEEGFNLSSLTTKGAEEEKEGFQDFYNAEKKNPSKKPAEDAFDVLRTQMATNIEEEGIQEILNTSSADM